MVSYNPSSLRPYDSMLTYVELLHSSQACFGSLVPLQVAPSASLSVSFSHSIFISARWSNTAHDSFDWPTRHPIFTRALEVTFKDPRRLSQEPSQSSVPYPNLAPERWRKDWPRLRRHLKERLGSKVDATWCTRHHIVSPDSSESWFSSQRHGRPPPARRLRSVCAPS